MRFFRIGFSSRDWRRVGLVVYLAGVVVLAAVLPSTTTPKRLMKLSVHGVRDMMDFRYAAREENHAKWLALRDRIDHLGED